MGDVTFNRGRHTLLTNNWTSAAYKALLLDTAVATPDKDLDFVSDLVDGVNNIESTAANYVRKTFTNPVLTIVDASDLLAISSDPLVWTTLGVSGGPFVRAMVFYLQTGGNDASPTDDPLVCFIDLTDRQTNGLDFTLTPPSPEGWIKAV